MVPCPTCGANLVECMMFWSSDEDTPDIHDMNACNVCLTMLDDNTVDRVHQETV